MKKGMVLVVVVLVALLQCACAETQSGRGSSVVNRAATCAACGAAINDSYFINSADKAMGPGSY